MHCNLFKTIRNWVRSAKQVITSLNTLVRQAYTPY